MEWFKDPKNQNKVAGILVGVILLVVVLAYFLYSKAPSTDTSSTSSAPVTTTDPGMADPNMPSPGMADPNMPGNGMAPTTPTAPAPQVVAGTPAGSGTPIEAWRPDPFLPLNYRAPTRNMTTGKKPIPDLPLQWKMFQWKPPGIDSERAELAQPSRRMAGLLDNGGVFAIIESNGKSEIVRPGDTLQDRLASVERIERDKVILRTKDAKPRYIVVRMAASPN